MEKQPFLPMYNEEGGMKQPTAPLMENATGSYPSAVNQGQLQQFKVWPCPMTGQQMVHHQQHQQQLQQKVCFAPVQPQTIVVVNQTPLNDKPVSSFCPHCQKNMITSVEYQATWQTHLTAALLCFLFLWPCACASYCSNWFKDTVHSCSRCHKYIGTFHYERDRQARPWSRRHPRFRR